MHKPNNTDNAAPTYVIVLSLYVIVGTVIYVVLGVTGSQTN